MSEENIYDEIEIEVCAQPFPTRIPTDNTAKPLSADHHP